jgi:hypothetical protein
MRPFFGPVLFKGIRGGGLIFDIGQDFFLLNSFEAEAAGALS